MGFRLAFLIVLFISASGCGKKSDFVTLTLLPGGNGALKSTPNLMTELTAHSNKNITSSTSLFYGPFCHQNDVLTGVLVGSGSTQQFINFHKIGMNNNFTSLPGSGASAPSDESAITSLLNSSATTNYNGPIQITVPMGPNVEVGVIGNIRLDSTSAQDGSCTERTFSNVPNPFEYVSILGKVSVATNTNTTVQVPLKTVRQIASTTLDTSSNVNESTNTLQSFESRHDFIMVWVNIPAVLVAGDSLEVVLDPTHTNNPAVEVKYRLHSGVTTITTLPSAAPTSTANTYYGFAIPHIFPMKFFLNINGGTIKYVQIINDDSTVAIHNSLTAGKEPIKTLVVPSIWTLVP